MLAQLWQLTSLQQQMSILRCIGPAAQALERVSGRVLGTCGLQIGASEEVILQAKGESGVESFVEVHNCIVQSVVAPAGLRVSERGLHSQWAGLMLQSGLPGCYLCKLAGFGTWSHASSAGIYVKAD